ncbi:biotin--acetyl-CoA-carboxylase ligase [Bifidobacterium sp. ESL0690]|uniref:biotin--[acetyl-CoA-carboxylase] ligase n=1 Tax=Bifidobacterium sp. ESL0690 TaxID=2983214 RepID=UPI0023F833D0|nr:biotin--acetyl-CoA-carboxylase ligase [Bifidobacterium sp. ESL0690]WEV46432.1 biotin--acetyl-CoA-carboxylase ligase [Bifidobacterium sp. ESL0690]
MDNETDSPIAQRVKQIEKQYADFAKKVGASKPQMPETAGAVDELMAFATLDSTNILARKMLAEGELGVIDAAGKPRMAAMCADAQTAGHGRLGRQWSDKAGGASFLVTYITALPKRLVTDSHYNGWFTIIAGLAALDALNDALAKCGAKPLDPEHGLELKWPNDIFYNGHKLGGILAELVQLPEGLNRLAVPQSQLSSLLQEQRGDGKITPAASVPNPDNTANSSDTVLQSNDAESFAGNAEENSDDTGKPAVGVMFGIGINLDLAAESLPTPISTSLQLLYAPLPDPPTMRDMVAARLAMALKRRLASLVADPETELPKLLEETRAKCWTLGRQVEAKFTDGSTLAGQAISLNSDASLTIQDAHGAPHVVKTGDVGVLA